MNFNYKQELKSTILLAVPVIIGQLGHMMMGVVDSLMVGKVGAAPLAASSITNGIFMLFMIFGIVKNHIEQGFTLDEIHNTHTIIFHIINSFSLHKIFMGSGY